MASSKRRFFWLDLEMTGLNPLHDRILETAVIITDKYFDPIFEWDTTIYQPPKILKQMNEWCQNHHQRNGLLDRIKEGINEEELDDKLCEIAQCHLRKDKKEIVLCGNSISHDRRFIETYLPKFNKRLHYRVLDVTSWKIIFRDIYKLEYKKKNQHLALSDIKESLNELKYYLQFINLDTM